MRYQDAISLIEAITVFYQNFSITEAKVKEWALILQEYDAPSVSQRLRDHVRTSKFPPTIADLLPPQETEEKTNVSAYRLMAPNTLDINEDDARAYLELLEGDRFEGKTAELPSFLKRGKR
jgi:hypothetical protein